MSTSRRRCLSAWGHSRHAPSFRAPVMNRRRRANGHPRVFSGARDVPRHARGRPFPQRCRHRPVVSHDLPGLLGTAPRGVVSPQRHPHQGQATINTSTEREQRNRNNLGTVRVHGARPSRPRNAPRRRPAATMRPLGTKRHSVQSGTRFTMRPAPAPAPALALALATADRAQGRKTSALQ